MTLENARINARVVVLNQLAKGPVWDGHIISKADRDALYKLGFVDRADGYNFLTVEGVKICVALSILHV